MRVLFLVAFLLFFYVAAQAQDKVKISASFTGSDVGFDDRQGLGVELDAKIIGGEYLRLGGVFRYDRACFDCSPKTDIYSAGPQLSYELFQGRVSAFGRALFGATTTYNSDKRFTRTYGAGVDVNLGNVFIRPFVIDFLRVEGVLITVNRYGVGGGIRF